MAISFDTIPAAGTLKVPGTYFEFDAAGAHTGLFQKSPQAAVIGQRLSTGTVAKDTKTLVSNKDQAKGFFGRGSVLAHMCEAFLAENPFVPLYAVALDDPSGAKATGDIVFSGTATADGTVAVYVGGRKVEAAISSGDNATAVGAAVVSAVAADTDLACTSGNAAGTVTFTAKNEGQIGNEIEVRLNYEGESLPAGVTAAPTQVQLSSGAGVSGTADFESALAALGEESFDVIAWHLSLGNSTLGVITDELEDRWDYDRRLFGHAIGAHVGDVGALQTLASAEESEHLTIVSSYKSPTPSYEVAASAAGVVSYYSAIDPARPFQTLELSHVKAPATTDLFTHAERNTLLLDGIGTTKVSAAGEVRLERLPTMKTKNAAGGDELAWQVANTPLTLALVAYDAEQWWLSKHPRDKLAESGSEFGAGQKIVTPETARGEWVGRYLLWQELGLVQDVDYMIANSIFDIPSADPSRLDVRLAVKLVSGLRVTAVQIPFTF